MYFYCGSANGASIHSAQDTAGYASRHNHPPDAKKSKEEIDKGKEWLKKYVGI
jgi:hypothetical protein